MGWKEDFNYGLAAFGLSVPEGVSLDAWAAKLGENAAAKSAAVVGASATLFYLAERGRNPKVKDVWDAAVYASTCLSVGYGDIFPHTTAGKIIGSTLMTLGPALSSRVLDGPTDRMDINVQEQILAALRLILEELRAKPAGAGGP